MPGVNVADVVYVDEWSKVGGGKIKSLDTKATLASRRFFFLSHLHTDHTHGLSSSWSEPVYTSQLNAELIRQKFFLSGLRPHLIRPLSLDRWHRLVTNEQDEDVLSVRLLPANHAPGAVMFLFRGCLGNILVTADFRVSPGLFSQPDLADLSASGDLDRLVLDNTFFSPEFAFPSRDDVLLRLLAFLHDHPDHAVHIGARQLGKEDVVVAVARSLNEKVCVSRDKLRLFRSLGLADVFTTDPAEARIYLVDSRVLNRRYLERENETRPTLGVLLTALYFGWPGGRGPYTKSGLEYDLHVFELSDHSSYDELVDFVRWLRPKEAVPLLAETTAPATGIMSEERADFFRKRADFETLEQYYSKLPKNPCEPGLLECGFRYDVGKSPARKRPPDPARLPYRGPMGAQYVTTSESSEPLSEPPAMAPVKRSKSLPAEHGQYRVEPRYPTYHSPEREQESATFSPVLIKYTPLKDAVAVFRLIASQELNDKTIHATLDKVEEEVDKLMNLLAKSVPE